MASIAFWRACAYFQSTLPVRGATYIEETTKAWRKFQSTLPVRGATQADNEGRIEIIISIHAPREGSDSNLRQNKDLYFGENATCFKK